MKIFLIGMMGAGKSSIGLILSKKLGWSFFDIDKLIDIDSYFNHHSLDQFRLEETSQIKKVVANNTNCIISVGAGAILSDKNRSIMTQNTCVFLKGKIDTLIDRIKNQDINRPLIKFLNNGDIDRKSFIKIYKEREGYYLDLADLIIDTNNDIPLNIAMYIKDKIINHEIIN